MIIGSNTLPANFNNEKATMETVLRRFKVNCEKYGDFFDYKFL